MRRTWLRVFGTGFVGTTLLMGCQHSRHCESCSVGAPVAPAAPYVAAQKMPSASTYHEIQRDPNALPPMPLHEPVEATKLPDPPEEQPSKAETEELEQAAYAREVADAKKALHGRRSFHDITADPCFDHAADYAWIIGELYFEKDSKTWTVRYASVDEDDCHGGKVTLTDAGAMDNLRSGQMVRVEGRMADPAAHDLRPAYKVQTIELVKD
ncbi:MAG: hypothetical protein ACJ8FY_17470 [Gemmataceae bacterium]